MDRLVERFFERRELELAPKQPKQLLVGRRLAELAIRTSGIELQHQLTEVRKTSEKHAHGVLALEFEGLNNCIGYFLDAHLLVLTDYKREKGRQYIIQY